MFSIGEQYYTPYIGDGEADYEYHFWHNSCIDRDRYGARIACHTKEEAINKAECILAFLQKD